MIDIAIDISRITETIATLAATGKQQEKACYRALKKTQKHIETDLKRAVAQKLGIPVKAIGDRFFHRKLGPGVEELQVWVGTWNVSLYSVGNPAQTTTGVKVGSLTYRGAFKAKIYAEKEEVYIRRHSPHYSPELYPYSSKARAIKDSKKKNSRYPVVRAAIPIDEELDTLLNAKQDEYAKKFEDIYIHELDYATMIEG